MALVHPLLKLLISLLMVAPLGVARDVKYLVTFGSSTTQTGFQLDKSRPSASNPLGNPSLPGWTTSGGLNWLGYLITEFNASTIYSYNLAVGGATTDSALIPPYSNTVKSFINQVDELCEEFATNPPWTSENLLVGIWIGNNDVGNSFAEDNKDSLYLQISTKYIQQLQKLYKLGARSFVILSAGPQHWTPLMISKGPTSQAKLKSAVELYNHYLGKGLKSFLIQYKEARVWFVNSENAYSKALDNATIYGAPNSTCENPDGQSCLWWNNYHPGTAIHRLLAKEVAGAVGNLWFSQES
ncbi:related to cellulose-binding GDSL lipase/acylhydrolase [Fusarium mangiferae]|uniref:Related to cellulose-binding GDSL lipase/acylhydrolase n=1 Tax=Fusarium mangiferae TaxID=192010 RepID=A0A1L7U467_FUSMA|nr:uncharacterized protein FMAN_00009 [Fusarium mangiferae]CVL02477.1 related to cellulose-binding GDSL lipase/acylhydrolase [Fusarium mangiferae]